MKYTLRLLPLILFIMAHNVYGQNKITLHLTDTVITLYGVDSVYYGYNEDSDYVQTVVTFDSTYSFAVDDIDSMKYQGPRIVANGVVHGGDTSMMVVSLTDIQHLTDTAFSLMAYSGDYRQLLIVTNSDTMPIMMYRGNLEGGQQIVIDTLSTIEALVTGYLPLSILADTDYATFDSLLHNVDSFAVLYQLVGQSIANRRSLVDSTNQRMFEVLSDVISQMSGLEDTTSNAAKSTHFMGNHTMEVQALGSEVKMRMWHLNPTYVGTVTDDESNVIVDNLRVASRDDYGVMQKFWSLFSRNYRENFDYGDCTSFNMTQGGDGSKLFYFSCKSLQAQIDFYLTTFILPAMSFIGIPYNGNCTRSVMTAMALKFINNDISNYLHNGSATPGVTDYLLMVWENTTELIKSALDATFVPQSGNGFVMYSSEYADCIRVTDNVKTIFKSIAAFNKIYTGVKVLFNTSLRCYYFYHEAPDNISFCFDHYGTNPTRRCSYPELLCYSGNGQQGDPGDPLNEPIVLKISARDDEDNRVQRHLHLHLSVVSGNGVLGNTFFDIMTDNYYDIQRQTTWQLGTDTSIPQQVSAWLTDPDMNNAVVGVPISISAFFHQTQDRIDSFRVAANRYVSFSSGNLQYQPSSATWRFAEHQYDVIGSDNLNITNNDDSYTGWIDLFSWATAYIPTFVPINNSFYDSGYDTFFDWGIHPISNGGAQANMWRTPTFAEWNYVINSRPNHSNLYTYATVCGVHGMILLPDNWVQPDDVTFTPQQHNWTTNVYDATSWRTMEGAGAIFLPAAGNRILSNTTYSLVINNVGNAGHYWSASGHVYYPTYGYTPSQHAYRMGFFGSTGNPPQGYTSVECYWGLSVRLIRNL